jgi:hypothetical protein
MRSVVWAILGFFLSLSPFAASHLCCVLVTMESHKLWRALCVSYVRVAAAAAAAVAAAAADDAAADAAALTLDSWLILHRPRLTNIK